MAYVLDGDGIKARPSTVQFLPAHSGLGGKTPAGAAGISIGGDDKYVPMTWNAAVRTKADAVAGAA